MQQYPNVIMRTYVSIPAMFNAIVGQEVDGIIVDRLDAIGYIQGQYAGKLKIVGSPLNNDGLHFVALKKNPETIKMLSQRFQHLVKKKKVKKLQKKWLGSL